ncbi:MAG: alanine--tRNA ligase [Clostridia bacterium]|nr:alanine--tRNA ligase [Clostridia bacterium]
MEKLGLNELRKKFLEFFESKDHYVRPSYSLIPEKDKSLLLINAGMAPLKPYYMGIETPPSKRMATSQKCIRTGDIENVGYTARHATFFEMMGNFSFGDYFKKESIAWGWEFVRQHLHMPIDKLWISIYEEDEEAYEIWKHDIGISEDRIVRLGKSDNFWEIGVGPCGPCSEIYFDRGEQYGCDNSDCKPGCDCDRYVEFWNHVFTQFNRDEEGNYIPLPNPNIDTGMGLERIACIMQGVESIFEVDTLSLILNSIAEKAGIDYQSSDSQQNISVRVITDHIRSVTFLVCDGVLPSNEGRGYILRRLLRRASRHGKLIGIEGIFLTDLVDQVIKVSKEAYPELEEREDYIKKIVSIEEERFQETIDQGTNILNEYMNELNRSSEKELSGEKAFKLYDTFGFPLELTEEILKENGYSVNYDDFNAYMEKQKNMSRSARKSSDDVGWEENLNIDVEKYEKTDFTGYQSVKERATVQIIIKDNEEIDHAAEGHKIKLVLDTTPFYAESGGQQGDVGSIIHDTCEVEVLGCEKYKDFYIHDCIVKAGSIHKGDMVTAQVNMITRNASSKNHTATHLLHKALKDVLGQHVDQAGSLVTPDRLRFDFTHFEGISKDDLNRIEEIVNEKISENLQVCTEETDIKTATSKGAIGLFGEKYGEIVRIVQIGDYSIELCGGIHVNEAGQIGLFKILSENGVAAGVRRIEAITGNSVYQHLKNTESILNQVNNVLKSDSNNIINKLENLVAEHKVFKKDLEEFKKQLMTGSIDEMINRAEVINNIKLIVSKFENTDIKDLRNISDDIKKKSDSTVIVFASINDGKIVFLVSVTDNLLDKGVHAGKLIKQIASVAGGGGGGKADMAQAGGKDPAKVDDALKYAKELLGNL